MKRKSLKYTAILASTILGTASMTVPVMAQSSSAAFTTTTIAPIAPGAPMNPYNASGLTWIGLDLMPLAWIKIGETGQYWPSIATKWQLSNNGSALTVWLRPNAKWSNGAPVTSADVMTTFASLFATGAVWFNLQSMQAVGPHEVVFHMTPGVKFNQFENGVLEQIIVPASVYGHLLPKDIWTLIHESLYAGTAANLKALAAKAQTSLTAIGKSIASFAPAADVSSGPFKITGVNPGEVVLDKTPTYWDAKNIHVNQVILRSHTSSEQIWNYLISGQVDNVTSGMPLSIKQRILQTPGNVFYKVPGTFANSLIFNEHDYPYNMLPVRRALAYLINRAQTQHIGAPVGSGIPKYVDGMTDVTTRTQLTPQQRSSLTLYRYNPAKAASILESAGFKKVNGQWMLPNGKPWTASIAVNASYSSWVKGVSFIANEMTSFGIPTKSVLVMPAEFATEQMQGAFPLSFWSIGLGPLPYDAYLRLYGSPSGNSEVNGQLQYTPLASQGNWVDFPQNVFLSGFGRVNAGQLTNQLVQSYSQTTLHKDTFELALISNKFLPAITLWDSQLAGFVNTTRFTDYPLNNQEVMLSSVFYPPGGFWMDMGYIRPKG